MARDKKTTKCGKIMNSKNNTLKMIKIWMKKYNGERQKTTKCGKIMNSKNNTVKMTKIWIKKLINAPVTQVSFM